MSVRSNSNYRRRQDEGEVELVLVVITYTGDRSIFAPQGMRTEGGYPALDQFRGPGPDEDVGETKLVELPSSRLGWWENHSHFEVSYEEDEFARAMLDRNYVPEQIAGPGYDPDLREQITEKLGLDPFTGEEDLREQLRDVAGVSEEADEEAQEDVPDEPEPRVDRLMEVDRSVLLKVAGSYDEVDEVLEEEEKDNVSHLSNTAVSEFLADQDDDEVDRRISTAEQGGEI